ncbi:hypothetical protein B0H10DRAFT_2097775 [Mycena sp. CBHHK59/15]|nr:hypothetical protein B0H10DRAFT_2097775 [Mycena sp. CBHHK59/15]
MFTRYSEMERKPAKPSWVFPSPFIPYSPEVTSHRGDTCWGPEPRTLAEMRMYGLSWAIRSKSEWQRKITDSAILEKWRKEALDQQAALPLEEKMTPNMINYVLTELAGYSRLSDMGRGIESGCFDAIWYSDRLVPTDVSNHLRCPEDLKDWHPGSNGQVLDLVHPSLYCISYNRTHCLGPSNLGFTALQPPEYDGDRAEKCLSTKFCWLPSDFAVDAVDGSVKLVSSYINNLHPVKQKFLYGVIESVLSSFVLLFEHVLSQVNGEEQDLLRDMTPGSGRIITQRTLGTWAGYSWKFAGISTPCIWSKGEPKWTQDLNNETWERLREEYPKVLPEAYEKYTGELEKSIRPYSLRGKTIQCIIKLANIHLSPDNPEYKGGSWHVEGMLNEHIVASGIYYYEEDNITESQLAFRVTTAAPVYHQQDDFTCSEILYGIVRSHCCQTLGAMVTKAGRALAWPNIYQHRVSPFRLVDSTKPGHRKILAIFLVDPSIEPIPSATHIPPQQADWAFDALEKSRLDPQSAFSALPPEISEVVRQHFPDTLVTREETEADRLTLMKERTRFVQTHSEELRYSFNMCEH